MPSEKSNLSKHLNSNITHHFSCAVICNAPVKKFTCKILEVYFIALLKLTRNDQSESDLLHLFKIELHNFIANEIANIWQRHSILTLDILAFPILFIYDFNSTDNGLNSEKLLLLIILCNLFYSIINTTINYEIWLISEY